MCILTNGFYDHSVRSWLKRMRGFCHRLIFIAIFHRFHSMNLWTIPLIYRQSRIHQKHPNHEITWNLNNKSESSQMIYWFYNTIIKTYAGRGRLRFFDQQTSVQRWEIFWFSLSFISKLRVNFVINITIIRRWAALGWSLVTGFYFNHNNSNGIYDRALMRFNFISFY